MQPRQSVGKQQPTHVTTADIVILKTNTYEVQNKYIFPS